MDDGRTLSDKLSGRFRHPEDAGGRTILTGRLLRSPRSAGRVSVLDLPTPPAGVVSVIGSEIPGSPRITLGSVPVPVLSSRDVLWEGQPILAAAGPDEEALEDWLSRIRVDFTEGAGNQEEPEASKYRRGRGDITAPFSQAFQVVEEALSIPSQPNPGKTRTVSCIRDGSAYIIHAATSWPGAVRKAVSRVLKIDRRVAAGPGGFPGRAAEPGRA